MARFSRYLVVGTIAFLVDYSLLVALVPFLPILVANTIAFLVANAVNFALAHGWVFRQSLASSEAGGQYLRAFTVSLVGLALNDLAVWLCAVVLAAPLLASKVAATVLVLSWNYGARLLWVYRAKP